MGALLAVHVGLSLIGIGSGFVMLYGFLGGRRLDTWAHVFLATTVLTSVTGYGLPADHLLPSHVVGAISLVVLALAIVARSLKSLAGRWRATYVVTSVVALYLNVFVLVVQAFRRVPALSALAPTQSEPPFGIAQGVVLVFFIVLGWRATVGFRTA